MLKIGILAFLLMLVSLIITPMFIKFAFKIKATDKPDHRKVHTDPIPTLGGLVIFISFLVGLVILQPYNEYHISIIVASFIIIGHSVVDDIYNLTPKIKFIFQLSAALLIVFWGGLQVELVNLPFGGQVELGFFSSVVTLIWIIGLTNAMNLIDGLDGLAAGVSAIALFTIAMMAIAMNEVYVATMALILFFSTVGFLRYNFFPAKIFMGDTGSQFLGFMIAVLSLLGFKNLTIISFIIPIFIAGVPLSDIILAIVRRTVNKQPLTKPDSSHLHHSLVRTGFTHRQTVLLLYGLSVMFNLAAVLFSMTTIWGAVLIFLISVVAIQFLVENLELINSNFKPLTKMINVIRRKS